MSIHVILEKEKRQRMSKEKNRGQIWPIAIGVSILLIFFAAIATVMVAVKHPIEESDLYMRNYHDIDANINQLVKDRISFDKVYKLKYVTEQFKADKTVIKYKITDMNGVAVNNAKIEVKITRPDIHKYDMSLKAPSVNQGIYSFEEITLPKEGRWDILAKISVGDKQRYMHLKVDTRNSYVEEPQY